jgi:hypothetical protein
MNFLALTRRLAVEAGSSANISSVVAQSGEAGRMAGWTSSAWDDVQLERPDWYWMRGSFSFPTVAGDMDYSPADAGIATRFGMWDTNSFRAFLTNRNDELKLSWLDYESFRDSYMIGPQIQSRPMYASIAPNLNILLGPIPEAAYTINGEYFKAPQTLTVDDDEPEIPAQFQMIIVYRALMLYARYEAAAEIYADAEMNYKRMLRRLELNQLPTVEVLGTLA